VFYVEKNILKKIKENFMSLSFVISTFKLLMYKGFIFGTENALEVNV